MRLTAHAGAWVLAVIAPAVLAADPPAAPEPVELKTLRMEYQQRLMKAQTPADDWYRMQLRTLLARYKQTGNLDAAVTAQSEMENPDPAAAAVSSGGWRVRTSVLGLRISDFRCPPPLGLSPSSLFPPVTPMSPALGRLRRTKAVVTFQLGDDA